MRYVPDVCRRLAHLCPSRREVGILRLDGALAELMLFPERGAGFAASDPAMVATGWCCSSDRARSSGS